MFNRLNSHSLGVKFVLMVTGILIITTGVVTHLYIRSQYQLQLDSLLAKGRALGHFVSLISPQPILAYDFEGMNEFMREISQEEDIVYGFLVAKNGINLTRYIDKNNPYITAALNKVGEKDLLAVIREVNTIPEIISLEFPVWFKDQQLGKLILGISRDRVDHNYRQVLFEMLLANTIIIAFLSVCIYVGFRIMAMKPIDNLRLGLRRVAEGDLDSKVGIRANDEIGSLTNSFNDMVTRLDQTISEKDVISKGYQEQAKELALLNVNLQERVQESSRIMRDLHDDVGAKLLTLTHCSESQRNAEMARSALKDLRETLRGLGQKETAIDLGDALADWRAEASERLKAANIKLEWLQSDELPETILNNRQLINLSRIIREAISNAIRHAIPDVVTVSVSVNGRKLQLSICDDGDNSSHKDWVPGTGVNNMQRRAKELDGSINWRSRNETDEFLPTGTCVDIFCPLVNGE